MAEIEKLAEVAISRAKSLGASYADCRHVEIREESLSYTDGAPDAVSETTDIGFGVRVVTDGAWGFFGSSVMTEKEAKRAAEMAVEIAKASASLNKIPLKLAPVSAFSDKFVSQFKTDPFTIGLKEKLGFLANLDNLMTQNSQVNSRGAHLDFRKTSSYFASTIGSKIYQTIIHSGVGIELGIKKSRRERFVRSFPQNGGQYECKGYELISEFDFAGEIPRLSEEAIALSTAIDCPSTATTLVVEGSVVGLLIHELVGHPLELDRVFGSERNFSGTSFATTDQLDKLQYTSKIVNIVSDATHPYGLGSFGYDDEGVKARSVDLIKDGILTGYLSSRETAAKISRDSSGAMRADGWGNIPIVRMTNTNISPGDKTLDDLISAVDDGIYMSTISSWSPSDDRSSFQFGCEIGWEIKGGKLGQAIKNPTFSGRTVEFWNSVQAIGSEAAYRVWGTPNCGKGQPGQNARTGQGGAPILLTNIKVGEA
jgi:TldD protein